MLGEGHSYNIILPLQRVWFSVADRFALASKETNSWTINSINAQHDKFITEVKPLKYKQFISYSWYIWVHEDFRSDVLIANNRITTS